MSCALALLVTGTSVYAQGPSESSPSPPEPTQAADTPCDRHGFSTVFTCILHDLRDVARADSLVWLGTGAVLAGGSVLLDDEVRNGLTDESPDASLAAGESLGHAGMHFGVPLTIYAVARMTHHDEAAANRFGRTVLTGAIGVIVDRDGITDVGAVTHLGLKPGSDDDEYGYEWQAQIHRSLVIGDLVYTVSEKGVKASSLTDLSDIAWVSFR